MDVDVYIFVCLLFSLVLRRLVLLLSLFSEREICAGNDRNSIHLCPNRRRKRHLHEIEFEIQRGRDTREHSRGFLFTFLRLRGGNDRNSNRGFDGKHFLCCVFKSVGVLYMTLCGRDFHVLRQRERRIIHERIL